MPLATKRTTKVVTNRAAFEQIRLGMADGMFGVAMEIIDHAHPPDAPPYGKGLVEGGGAVVWIDKKKVDGTLIGGKQIKKPRHLALPTKGICAIAGWGFPARFVEFGTVKMAAHPFLTLAATEVLPEATGLIGQRMKKWLRGIR